VKKEQIMRSKFDLSVYLVVGPNDTKGRVVADVIREAIRGGVTFVQLRAKQASDSQLLELAQEIADVIAELGKSEEVAFVIDDVVDAVRQARELGIKVDGVHIGQSDLPPEHARRLLGEDAIIGLTAPAVGAGEASAAGTSLVVDYFGVGPVHPSATKPDCGVHNGELIVQGAAGVDKLAKLSPLPVVAGGGITLADIPDLAHTDISGFFVVSAIAGADDPYAAARELSEAWSKSRTRSA
jgi:thiamine-phosphate diphosphorylase